MSGSRNVNALCNEAEGVHDGNCLFPAYGRGASTQLFQHGQCTWKASEIWKQQTGVYAGSWGNAKDWAASAARDGWTVINNPMERSIVVIQPSRVAGDGGSGSIYGHVAWVNFVEQRSDGVYLHITDMNRANDGKEWSGYRKYASATMSFILA